MYSFDKRYPILLPKRHKFVEMLIVKIYKELNHVGWSSVYENLSNRLWIVIKGQSTVFLFK